MESKEITAQQPSFSNLTHFSPAKTHIPDLYEELSAIDFTRVKQKLGAQSFWIDYDNYL